MQFVELIKRRVSVEFGTRLLDLNNADGSVECNQNQHHTKGEDKQGTPSGMNVQEAQRFDQADNRE